MVGANKGINIQSSSNSRIFDNMQEEVIIYEIMWDILGIVTDLRVKYVNNVVIKEMAPEIIGKSVAEIYGTEIADLHLKMANDILKSGQGKKYKVYFESLNRYFSVSAYLHGDNTYITISTDITQYIKLKRELKQAYGKLEEKVEERTAKLEESNEILKNEIQERKLVEETLLKSEQKFRSVIEQSYNGIALCDEQGVIIEWNHAQEVITGKKREEVIGKFLWDVSFHSSFEERRTPEAYKRVKESLLKMFKTGKVPINNQAQEHGIQRPDGKRRFIEELAFTIPTAKGVMACGILQDITDRKKIEESLRKSEEKFRETLQQSYDGIALTDEHGIIIEWNPALEQITGWKKDDMIGNSIWDMHYRVSPEEKQTHELVEKLKSMQISLLKDKYALEGNRMRDKEIQRSDGKRIFLQSIDFPIKTEEGIMLGSFNRDITEYKKAEKQLKETVEELKRSNEELQRFAYVASHDLQEPLRTIASFTQLLERRYKGRFDSDADEFMDYIVEAAIRMKNLIGGLLEYSRISTKMGEFQPIEIGLILNQTIDNLQYAIKENNAKIRYDKMPVVMGNEVRLQRVFQNLISNAIKFKKEESDPEIHISAVKDENNMEYIFSVQDNGIGIEKQYLNRIFVIFQRLHTPDEYSGTGIGLSIVKRIIELHGGHIWVESEFGVGSTFYFTIPY